MRHFCNFQPLCTFDLLFGGKIGDEAARITCNNDAFSSRTKIAHVFPLLSSTRKIPGKSQTSFCYVAKLPEMLLAKDPLFEFVNKLLNLSSHAESYFRRVLFLRLGNISDLSINFVKCIQTSTN